MSKRHQVFAPTPTPGTEKHPKLKGLGFVFSCHPGQFLQIF